MELMHIAIVSEPDKSVCIPFVNGKGDYWNHEQEAHIRWLLEGLLEDPNVEKIGQNLSFDATFR